MRPPSMRNSRKEVFTYLFYFSTKTYIFGYSLEASRRGTSSEYHNIYFQGEIRKQISVLFGWKKCFIWRYVDVNREVNDQIAGTHRVIWAFAIRIFDKDPSRVMRPARKILSSHCVGTACLDNIRLNLAMRDINKTQLGNGYRHGLVSACWS